MESILNQVDIYGVLAAILSVILTTVIPILSFRYRKLLAILKESRKFLLAIIVAWEDHKISEEEMKEIIKKVRKIIEAIKD